MRLDSTPAVTQLIGALERTLGTVLLHRSNRRLTLTATQTCNVVCASPDYWSLRGKPATPDDLRQHDCLVMESSGGALLDRWSFARNGELLLVPVLDDWQALESPSHFALYRPSQLRSKRVRAFVGFLVDLFSELEAKRPSGLVGDARRMPRPDWFGRATGRQSAFATRRRGGIRARGRLTRKPAASAFASQIEEL